MKSTALSIALAIALAAAGGAAYSAGNSAFEDAVELTKAASGSDQYRLGVSRLQEMAQGGDGRAHLQLAKLMLTREHQLPGTAEYAPEHLRKAAKLGTQGASLLLAKTQLGYGLHEYKGTQVGRDAVAEALGIFRELAAAGDAEAKWNLGSYELTHGDGRTAKTEAVELIRQAANDGNMLAAYWMAAYVENNTGRKDHPERLAYLKTAADHGHRWAKAELADHGKSSLVAAAGNALRGLLGADSNATPEIDTDLAAADLFQQHGPPVLVAGVGTAAVPQPAKLTTTAVPMSGAPTSTIPLGDATLKSELDRTRSDLAHANQEIQRLRTQLAQSSQVQLPSQLNQQGLSAVMDNDYETALTKFREAAKFDHAPAIANLGLLYLNGTAVPQDGKQAIALFKRAADMGNVTAAENAGRAYDYGIGIHRSRYQALVWYGKALDMGSAHAAAAIARLKAEP